jgi:hypothetical protein
MPWATLLAHGERAEKMRDEARIFVADVAEKTGGEPVFGEGTHLFKTEYRGEVVDTGDAVHAMAHVRAFSRPFRCNHFFRPSSSSPAKLYKSVFFATGAGITQTFARPSIGRFRPISPASF